MGNLLLCAAAGAGHGGILPVHLHIRQFHEVSHKCGDFHIPLMRCDHLAIVILIYINVISVEVISTSSLFVCWDPHWLGT